MKIIIPIIILLLGGATIFFLQNRNHSDSTTTYQEEKPQVNQQKPSQQEIKAETLPASTDVGNESPSTNYRGELKERMDQENIDPEYAEEVSEEDFREFILAAAEELESGDEMAIALTQEMKKIQIAQPNYKDIIRLYYEKCLEKQNLSAEVRNLCQDGLNDLN